MHRALIAAIAVTWFTPPGAVAQTFQFMLNQPRPTPLLSLPADASGFAAGDDFDGNGHCDLVVTTQLGAATFAGTSTGWVAGPTLHWDEQLPKLADMDGDGDRDLLFVPPRIALQKPLLLYQSTSTGLVSVALPPVMTGVPLQGVAVGDVDGDGFADLVLALPVGSPAPSLVLARGGPGLQFTLDLTAFPAGLPQGLWPDVLDADGDGDLDVVATNASSPLRLLRNTGGVFADATATLPATRTGYIYLIAGDFDGDGHDDCAASLGNGELDLLWGGAGGFAFAQAVNSPGGLQALWPADFDGDGDTDFLATWFSGLELLTNSGNRQFARDDFVRAPILRGSADVDGNGRDDVLYATAVDRRALLCRFEARYEGGASGGIPFTSGQAMGASAAGDIDGDGRTDLATPLVNQFTFDRALGGGLYRRTHAPWTTVTGSRPFRSELADLDLDGDLDLVLRDSTRLAVFDNLGGAFASRVVAQAGGVFGNDLRVADADNDGDPDLVYASDQGTFLARNLGGGQFASPVVVASAVGGCFELADVDTDGDPDLLVFSGTVQVILANDGAGNFAAGPGFAISVSTNAGSMCAGDFDRDGDQDLAVTDSASLRVHRNNGAGVYTDTTASDLPSVVAILLGNPIVADFDTDGDLDLAVMTLGTPGLQLLDNDGTGRFADRSAARVQPFPASSLMSWRLRAADIDDDGDVDLLAGAFGQHLTVLNHLRQCRSNVAPRLGGVADMLLMSGPGFGQPGLAMLGVGFAPAALPVPGLGGRLQLDPATLQIVAATTSSPIGVSGLFVPVPPDPLLFGVELWFQGAILPATGAAGFTNAVGEVVLK